MRLVVVGGGTAGIAAALQARELGADVALLEADEVGGTTLNRGPAPVRTLARAARLASEWSSWDRFGLRGPAPTPDLPAILARSAEVARYARDAMHLADHLRGYGVELAERTGPVTFTSPDTLRARDGRYWTGDAVILAVGGYAAPLPVPGAELALTYNDIPSLTTLPADAAVIGGADTGCQIASILADFGVRVTIFEAGTSLISTADPAVSAGLARAYQARRIAVRTNTRVSALEANGTAVAVRYAGTGAGADADGENAEDSAAFGAVFAAIGWPANTERLGLGAAGVQDGWSAIPVDASLRTNVPHIFAAGDVNGHAKLVQVARAEGRIAARNAISGPHDQASYRVVPSGSFTDPEYGQVGLTEPVAARGHDIVTGTADYRDLLRPVADGRPDGFCKLIADRRDHTILGGHVLGEYSAEIIQVIATAMTANLTVEQVAAIPFAFPTVTEAVGMAAQMICRELGVGQFPQVWSTLAPAARLQDDLFPFSVAIAALTTNVSLACTRFARFVLYT
jgi:pyruvate/2-oxoglutarate dehydrogenase complex dihydrolipoamide dehydrogenase (E3) component